MDGILNINKPAGMTSYRVVAAVKRFSGERRVGHAGTLDPDATGVLPVCLGKATRVIEFFMNTEKVYRTESVLGTTTDTYDSAGTVTATTDTSGVTRTDIETALAQFRGTIQQTPPMYSALKHQGRPLYDLARQGITVERKARTVTIHRLELLDFSNPIITLEVECSKGTYIRSLAHDLGTVLGCGAHVRRLERTRYGLFRVEDAIDPETARTAFQNGTGTDYLFPIDSVLGDIESITLNEEEAAAIITGKSLTREIPEGTGTTRSGRQYRRAYGEDGRFLAIVYRDKETGLWRPKKVFA